MPAVTIQVPLSNDHSAHTPNASGQIDLALLVSDYYGKQIRQGNSFKITGGQATLRPADNAIEKNVDKGINTSVVCSYIPHTKHSRKAWNGVFRQWRAQKNLRGAVGIQMRYDDMEFAYMADDRTSRTSTIYSGGLGDSDSEYLVLAGSSSETTVSPILEGFYSLEDFYNSQNPPAPASKYHISGTDIKQPKFGDDMFPEHQHFTLSAESSGRIEYMGKGLLGDDKTALTADSQSSPIETFPQALNVLCGLIHYDAYVMPDEDWLDDEVQLNEDFELYITIFIKSWKPLVYSRKSRNARNKKSRFTRSRSTSRSRRKGRK